MSKKFTQEKRAIEEAKEQLRLAEISLDKAKCKAGNVEVPIEISMTVNEWLKLYNTIFAKGDWYYVEGSFENILKDALDKAGIENPRA